MESRTRRASFTGVVLPALALLGLAFPMSLNAQEPETPQIDADQLEAFTRLHMTLVQARADYHDAIGRNHDPVGKAELRDAMVEQVAQIHDEMGMTAEEYERITFAISTDAALRESFEAILTRLAEEPAPGMEP